MTNSVNVADKSRLAVGCEVGRGRGDGGRTGQLLLCKVFIGRTAETKSSATPNRRNFPNIESIYRLEGGASSGKAESNLREWFVFNHELILPEYIIQFKYTMQVWAWKAHAVSHTIIKHKKSLYSVAFVAFTLFYF